MSTGDPQRSIFLGGLRNLGTKFHGVGKCEENCFHLGAYTCQFWSWPTWLACAQVQSIGQRNTRSRLWPGIFWKYPSPGHLTTLTYAIPTWDPNKSLKVHLYSILYISIESSKIIPFYFFGLRRNPDLRCRSPGEAAPGGMWICQLPEALLFFFAQLFQGLLEVTIQLTSTWKFWKPLELPILWIIWIIKKNQEMESQVIFKWFYAHPQLKTAKLNPDQAAEAGLVQQEIQIAIKGWWQSQQGLLPQDHFSTAQRCHRHLKLMQHLSDDSNAWVLVEYCYEEEDKEEWRKQEEKQEDRKRKERERKRTEKGQKKERKRKEREKRSRSGLGCFVILSLLWLRYGSPTEAIFQRNWNWKRKGRMRVEEKTNGTECNGKRKKQEDKSIFQERKGMRFRFLAKLRYQILSHPSPSLR